MASDDGTVGARGVSRSARVTAYALTAVSLGLCALVQLWFIPSDQPVGFDEGYMGALALRLIDGEMLPGVDGIGQRGPVSYWIVALFQLVFGVYHWWGFRVLAWLASSLVVLGLLALGALARRWLAGAIAGAFYAYTMFHQYNLGAGVAVSGELIAAPFLCWATVMTGLSLATPNARARTFQGVAAGALAGLAGWSKVTAMLGIVPLALWVLAVSLRAAPRSLRASAGALVPLVAGFLLPAVAIVLRYASAGAVDELVYRFFEYNRAIHMGPYAGVPLVPELGRWFVNEPWTAWVWLACSAALLAHLGYLAGSCRGRGWVAIFASLDVTTIVLLQALMGFGMGIVQMRFWPHQFVTGLPWAGFAIGLAVEWSLRALRPRWRPWLAAALALALGAGLVVTVGTDVRDRQRERALGGWKSAREDALCRKIQQYSRPDEYIFVWGFDGDLYVSCERRPATRFVYTTLIAGIVPPFWRQAKPERVARDAVALALSDLKETKPVLILDPLGWPGGTSVKAVPELRALLKKDYCNLETVVGRLGRKVQFHARKASGYCGKAVPSSE